MAIHQSKHQPEKEHHNGLNHHTNVNWPERIVSLAIGSFLVYNGLRKIKASPRSGIANTTLGTILLYRGASGTCPVYKQLHIDTNHSPAINIRTSMIIDKHRLELYEFWRRLENLPRFMTHLASVEELDGEYSHWEAIIPGGIGTIKWDAKIIKQKPGELLTWKSIEGSGVENSGRVKFLEAGPNQTELRVVITYHPPAGIIGAGIAKLLNPAFEKIVRNDIEGFKKFIENESELNTIGAS